MTANGSTPPPSPQPQAEDSLSLRYLWSVIVRNRSLVLGCLLVTPAVSLILAFLITPVYESAASIRIDEKKSGIPVLEALTSLTDQGSQLSTEMEMLRSRVLAEETVDSLALQVSVTTPFHLFGTLYIAAPRREPRSEILSQVKASRGAGPTRYRLVRQDSERYAVTEGSTAKPIRLILAGETISLGNIQFTLAPSALRHEVIQLDVAAFGKTVTRLRSALTIRRPQREANFVTVRYQSPDAQLTSAVPNALAAKFLSLRNQITKTEARSTVKFLREQIDTLSKQLASTEDALRAFREGNRVVSLSAEATVRVTELTRLQAERNAKESERAALQRALDEARQVSARNGSDSASAYRRLIAFPTLITTSASQSLQALNEAENQRAVLLQRRTREDRDVQVQSARIRELEQQLSANVQTYLSGLRSQIASMDAELAQFNQQLEKIPSKEMQYVRLERQNKVLADIYMLLETRLQEAQIAQAVEDSRVRVVDAALFPLKPIKPNRLQYLELGMIVGLLIGVVLAVVRESIDRAVHTPEDMTQLAGVASLGLIPHIETTVRSLTAGNNGTGVGVGVSRGIGERIVMIRNPRDPVTEAYRSLRTNITFARTDAPIKILVFTSPTPGDGKSTTAANLATTLAHQGLRVILLDGDMRRGTLHQVFDIAREPGLSNILIGHATVTECVQEVNLGDLGVLDIVPAGPFPPNPSELFGSARLMELLDDLQARYDMVIFDSPPVNLVTDAAVLGTKAGGVILIGRAGKTDKGAIAFAAQQLRNVRAPLLGTVLNDFDFRRDIRYSSYGSPGYYYYASYGYGYGREGGYGPTEEAIKPSRANGASRKRDLVQ
jgi:capsular exopolysaccharide synthesis family protein